MSGDTPIAQTYVDHTFNVSQQTWKKVYALRKESDTHRDEVREVLAIVASAASLLTGYTGIDSTKMVKDTTTLAEAITSLSAANKALAVTAAALQVAESDAQSADKTHVLAHDKARETWRGEQNE